MKTIYYKIMLIGVVSGLLSCATPPKQTTQKPESEPTTHVEAPPPQLSDEEAKKRIDAVLDELGKGFAGGPVYSLAEIRHPSVIPILESLLISPDEHFYTHQAALNVLARLRVKGYYHQAVEKYKKTILKEDLQSNAVHDAFEGLGYMGGNEAMQLLAKYLFNDKIAPPSPSEDVGSFSYRQYAARCISELIPESERPTKKIWFFATEEQVRLLRAWWNKNKDRYK